MNAPRGLLGLDGLVSLPSENSTIRAGGGSSPPPITAPTVEIACSAERIASPVAVRSDTCILSMASFVASWLVVGELSIVGLAANEISPRLTPGVSSSANFFAASCAAFIRVGATSVAFIDVDTSITSMTTARLRGILRSSDGPAIAMVKNTSASATSTAGHVTPPALRRRARR